MRQAMGSLEDLRFPAGVYRGNMGGDWPGGDWTVIIWNPL